MASPMDELNWILLSWSKNPFGVLCFFFFWYYFMILSICFICYKVQWNFYSHGALNFISWPKKFHLTVTKEQLFICMKPRTFITRKTNFKLNSTQKKVSLWAHWKDHLIRRLNATFQQFCLVLAINTIFFLG